jgi:uncharacterized surface protein with fasciclin (FAS1) repeats
MTKGYTMKLLNIKTAIMIVFASLAISTFANADHHGMKKDIVDVAAGNPDFSTLVAAVKAADLVDALKGDGPLTVFAPTNAAFAKLPAGTVESLLMPENKDKLVSILTYHVVSGKVMAADVVKVDSATSLQGQDITVKVDGGTVMVDNATVTATDIKASNGVIHVIDTVLMPKD